MNNFSKEYIEKLADLLHIGLTEEEKQMVYDEFNVIDANINKVNEIENISKVEPMSFALDNFECVLDEDVVEESVLLEDLLSNADNTDDGCVSVPKVVG